MTIRFEHTALVAGYIAMMHDDAVIKPLASSDMRWLEKHLDSDIYWDLVMDKSIEPDRMLVAIRDVAQIAGHNRRAFRGKHWEDQMSMIADMLTRLQQLNRNKYTFTLATIALTGLYTDNIDVPIDTLLGHIDKMIVDSEHTSKAEWLGLDTLKHRMALNQPNHKRKASSGVALLAALANAVASNTPDVDVMDTKLSQLAEWYRGKDVVLAMLGK